jgi:predicted TIM-barrel fold metal-dependent hydrolase
MDKDLTRRQFMKVAGVAGATLGVGGLSGLLAAPAEATTTAAAAATTAGPNETQGATATAAQASSTAGAAVHMIDSHVHVFSPEQAGAVIGLMDQHGADKALALVAIGLMPFPQANEGILAAVAAFPDRLACMVGFSTPENIDQFDGELAAKELEPYLKLPEVRGVGELALEAVGGSGEWADAWPRLRPVFDVVAENKKAVVFHTGFAPFVQRRPATRSTGAPGWISHRSLWWHNPIFIDDIAVEYPDVPIVISHIGVQGCFYYGTYPDMALMVAAKNPNVYLETSSAPPEVIEKAIMEPGIGPSRLLFGTDTPAGFGYYKFHGQDYPTYFGGKVDMSVVHDHYPECIRAIQELTLGKAEKQTIFADNAAGLFDL